MQGLPQRALNRLKTLLHIDWFYSDKYLLIYTIDSEHLRKHREAPTLVVNRNHFPDLEKFQQNESWLSRSTFLAEARSRIDQGMWCYTIVIDGVLAHYCWVVPNQAFSWLTLVEQQFDYPPNSAIMFNAYTHPHFRGRGLYYQSLLQKMDDAAGLLNASHMFTAVERSTYPTKKNLKKAGFYCHTVLFRKSRFGRVSRGRITHDFEEFL